MTDTTTPGQILDTVRTHVAELLYCRPEEIDPEATLDDLGLDSVLAVELIMALNAELGLAEKGAVIYEHPTVGTLSRHMATRAGVA